MHHLRQSDDVNALLEDRIYPAIGLDVETFYPFATYEMIGYQHEHDLDGAAGVANATIEINIIGDNHSEVIAAANAVKEELNGYGGMLNSRKALSVWLEDQSEDAEAIRPGSDALIYQQQLIFQVLHLESPPMLLLPADMESNKVEAGLVTYLTTQPQLSAVGNRIFPMRRPTRSALPAIVYQRKNTNEDVDMDDAIGLSSPVFEFEIFGRDHAEAYRLSEMMRGVLDGLTGAIGETAALAVTMLGETEVMEHQAAGKKAAWYSVKQDYELMHRN